LARAERLGYDVKDIVQEHNEHVIPSLHSLPVQPQPQPMEPRTNTALSARQYHTPPVASQTLPPPMQYVNEPATQTPTKYPSELPGLVWCKCGWPCASQAALDYVSCQFKQVNWICLTANSTTRRAPATESKQMT
jgi:hypothetical protein